MSQNSSGTSSDTAQVTGSPQPQTSMPTSGGLTFDQVQNYWIQAGGNPKAAAMAAAIADASSGLDPGISRTNPDGSTSIGLWLIPKSGQPPGSTDPLANARAALQLSQNGTDWSQWCVAWSDNNCGQDGGTYLGEGANALGVLGGTNEAYNVIGSSPAGSGTGASSATSSTSTGAQGTSSGHSVLLLALLAIVLIVVVIIVRRRTNTTPPEPQEVVPDVQEPM